MWLTILVAGILASLLWLCRSVVHTSRVQKGLSRWGGLPS
jgi:hypothetical protein